MITVNGAWEQVFEGPALNRIEERLPAFVMASRWFGGKGRQIQSAGVREIVPITGELGRFILLFVEIRYTGGGDDTYAIPITAAFGEEAEPISRECAQAVIEKVRMTGSNGECPGVLYDALWSEQAASLFLHGIGSAMEFHGKAGTVTGAPTEAFPAALLQSPLPRAELMKGEQSNSSIRFEDKAILKVYRRLEEGVNPDLEIGRVLTARGFRHTPAVLGALEYVREQQEPLTLAIAQQFIPNEGDGWRYTLRELQRYFDRIAKEKLKRSAGETSEREQTTLSQDLAGPYLDAASRLGQRTAELHMTLAQRADEQAFEPESCSPEYLRSRCESMRRLRERSMALLREHVTSLPEVDRDRARQVLEREPAIASRLDTLLTVKPTALRIRCHGDFHLGQVLYTGGDFVIIDFEGEPARPLAERRMKHLPIVDLAGMVRSFHYAVYAALRERVTREGAATDGDDLEPWARAWDSSARTAFMQAYMRQTSSASFQPRSDGEFALLLNVHLLEKAVYELGYELNNRPAWVAIPLQGILEEMKEA